MVDEREYANDEGGPCNGGDPMSDLATRPADPKTLREMLETDATQRAIAAVIPKHMKPERLMKVALVAVTRTPKLQECTAQSVLQAIMQAAELGLDCGGALGSSYLVPYGNTCTLIIGYRGLVDLARRSGQIESIESRPVYEGEAFELVFGLEPSLTHRPNPQQAPDGDKLIGVYVIARLKDGGRHVEWMTKAEINAIRSRSRAGTSGPWVTDFVEMARKTVVRRACKYLPLSPEMVRAIEIEDESGTFDFATDAAPRLPEPGRHEFGKPREIVEQPTTDAEDTTPEAAQAALDAKRAVATIIEERWGELTGTIMQKADCNAETARAACDAWLDEMKYDRSSLADDGIWSIVQSKAGRAHWAQRIGEVATA